ncbi:thioesterase II family protein [Kitasatospora sp. NPDC057940]|uniref:thioesterase II family protein n=1 Tax=Kitasatospora sp. NPDC057940 TaxID=3346285 RepID=UPI0036D8268D
MNDDQPWLVIPRPRPEATRRLVCLPHAGGSAGFYRPWANHLSAAVELQLVQYPGREERIEDPFVQDAATLVAQLTQALLETDRPGVETVVFGHSMGALLAYETVQSLHAQGLPVARLVLSGYPPPQAPAGSGDGPAGRAPARPRGDDELLATVAGHGGTQMSIFDDPDIREMVLPILRNDYLLIDSYRPTALRPVDCGVVVLTGDSDVTVSVERARGWEALAGKEFAFHVLPGGHFYLTAQRARVISLLHDYLLDGG